MRDKEDINKRQNEKGLIALSGYFLRYFSNYFYYFNSMTFYYEPERYIDDVHSHEYKEY